MGFIKKEIKKYINAWSSGPNVFLSHRDEKGKKFIDKISDYGLKKWYFYITKHDYERLGSDIVTALEQNEIRVIDDPVKFVVDGDWVRVYVSNLGVNERYSKRRSDDRLRLKRLLEKEGIKIFEGDIPLHKRYCLDNNVHVADNYRILYYDIEIDDRNVGIVIGRDTILTIAAVNQDGKEFFFHDKDEDALLSKFYDFVRYDYDILVGYNSDNFDKPYLEERFFKNCLEDEGKYFSYSLMHIDLMQVFIKRFAGNSDITSWSLDFIAKYFIGDGKFELGPKFGNGKGYKFYQEQFEDFKKYNIKDAKLLYDLNISLSIIDQIILECQICGSFPSKFSISTILDNYILKTVKGSKTHFASIDAGENQVRCTKCNHVYVSEVPIEEIIGSVCCMRCGTNFEPNNSDDDIIGAYVFDPEIGIHDDVYVFDYKSLYPSIIRTWNIGPDTLVDEEQAEKIDQHDVWDHFIKSANDQHFIHPETQNSAIKVAIERLLNLRKKYKKTMGTFPEGSSAYKAFNAKQNAVKMLCNSMYGLMGYQYGRYYRKEIAEAITLGGQWLNKQTKKWFENRGHRVIYGDTDSVFVVNIKRDDIDGILKELHDFYDDVLFDTFRIEESFIELEYEKHFKRLLLIKKKNYVGKIVELDGKITNKFIVKGLECIKRDTIPLAKKWQRRLVEMLINEEHSVNFYVEWVEEKMVSFFNNEYEIKDIIIQKKLTKNPTKYKVATVHATVAQEMMSKNMECYVGMSIPYIVTADKPIQAVHPDWYENNASISYYWDQQIFGILKRVLEVAFPAIDWDIYSTKIKQRRKKKTEQYLKWFNDPKWKLTKIIEKLNDDKVLSVIDKRDLKKKFGIRVFKKKKITLLSK